MRAFGNETFILVFLFPSLRVLEGVEVEFKSNYHNVASRSTCCYSGNLVFGGATNQDMSLNETCFYLKNLDFEVAVSNMFIDDTTT